MEESNDPMMEQFLREEGDTSCSPGGKEFFWNEITSESPLQEAPEKPEYGNPLQRRFPYLSKNSGTEINQIDSSENSEE